MAVKISRLTYFESGQAFVGFKIGVVPIGLLLKYDRYRTYKDFIDQGYNDTEARKLTRDVTKMNQSTIARDIYWFERDEDPFYAQARKERALHTANSR